MSDESSTEGVQTEGAAEGGTETVLTGAAAEGGSAEGGGEGAAAEGAAADVAVAQAILDADDPGLSADDKAAAKAIVDAAADIAGAEGSDTPPDTYADFVMPEGTELNETALAEASPLFKELGLNQEQAQKVIDLYAKQVQAGSQTQVENFNQLMSDWKTSSKNDGEFGGDKFEESVKIAQSAISKYGTPELKQLLEEHGVGNHPEVIRFMVRVGQTLNEDVPGVTGAQSSEESDRVSRMYPKTDA
jgi:hypothetical protein